MKVAVTIGNKILRIMGWLLCGWVASFTGGALAVSETVVIYAATDRAVVEPLIADFESRHPGIRVEYHDMDTIALYERFVREGEQNSRADIVWSSAMDLQMKLVNDGYAQAHQSAETAGLPAWAIWKSEAFGTTYEPIGFVYNKARLEPDSVPRTHAELARLLAEQPARFRGRLATYDPHRSGVGYLLHSQDLEANPVVFWNLVKALGTAGLQVEATTSRMLDRVARGDALLGYNILGSYALARANEDARVGVVLPSDYTLVISRVAFISRFAPHPAAARAWMDYVLSRRGQSLLNEVGLFSVRENGLSESAAAALRKRLGKSFRPVVIGTGLLTYMDRMKRQLFLDRWDMALQPGRNTLPGRPDASN